MVPAASKTKARVAGASTSNRIRDEDYNFRGCDDDVFNDSVRRRDPSLDFKPDYGIN
jgi:hypothetical protein